MGFAALYPSYKTASRTSPMADNDDIPFNRDFPLKPGVVDEARPGVRRVLCNNPSPFTFTGTVSYIVGQGNVVPHASASTLHENAWMPVMARPRISAWTSWVPS